MFKGIASIRCLVLPKISQPKYWTTLNFCFCHRMSSLAGDIDSGTTKQSSNLLTILERNPKRHQRIQFLAKLFETNGYELRIAGGAVRDILRGVEPQDIDFATTARPEQSLDILKRHENIVRIIVTASGVKHGTVAVKFKETEIDLKKIKLTHSPETQEKNSSDIKPVYDDESPFEITTLRCDTFTDGRHAEVKFINDWKIDAERRDLTINAMFLTLNDGKLVDYFGGESDLKAGIVRFVGDADLRIKEDYLRILRFFRFWARYGRNKQPDLETLATIEKNLDGLDIISGERIWVEIKKIFMVLPCYAVIKLMLRVKLFNHISVFDKNLQDDYDDLVEKVLKEVEKVQEKVQICIEQGLIDQLSKRDKRIRDLLPVILFSPVIKTPNMCLEACKRLKFSNLERDTLLSIVDNRDTTPTLKDLKYQLAMATMPERPLVSLKMKATLIYTGKYDLIEELDTWKVPSFPIGGNVVSQAVKNRKLPSNKTREVLASLKDDWAASDYTSSEDDLRQKLEKRLEELSA